MGLNFSRLACYTTNQENEQQNHITKVQTRQKKALIITITVSTQGDKSSELVYPNHDQFVSTRPL